jgi:hypothetical protein
MDKTNILQFEIEKHHSKMQDNNFKEQLSYFKSRDTWRYTKWTNTWYICYPILALLCVMYLSMTKQWCHQLMHMIFQQI